MSEQVSQDSLFTAKYNELREVNQTIYKHNENFLRTFIHFNVSFETPSSTDIESTVSDIALAKDYVDYVRNYMLKFRKDMYKAFHFEKEVNTVAPLFKLMDTVDSAVTNLEYNVLRLEAYIERLKVYTSEMEAEQA